MENSLNILKPTSLETTEDVVNCLECKLQSLNEQEKDVSSNLGDYIYLATNSIDSKLNELKDLKVQIRERETVLKTQLETIKVDSVYFLEQYGLDRLNGNLASSITISKGKESTTKQVFKTELTKKEIEKLVVDAGLGRYESEEIPATPSKIRVNKRKIALAEVVE